MRKMPAVLTFALGLLGIASVALAAGPSYRLQVDGLACPFCAYGIEKKLRALDGVDKVKVDLEGGQVVVTMKDGATLAEDTVRRAVKDAGFTLRAFEQTSGGSDGGEKRK
ncbi:MAG: heavy-metal-associated domain-containing protein [Pseudomonadota bacterium]